MNSKNFSAYPDTHCHVHRAVKKKPHPPTLSFKEICQQYEVASPKLNMLFKLHNGPQPRLRRLTPATGQNTFYDRAETRRWMRELQEKGIVKCVATA